MSSGMPQGRELREPEIIAETKEEVVDAIKRTSAPRVRPALFQARVSGAFYASAAA